MRNGRRAHEGKSSHSIAGAAVTIFAIVAGLLLSPAAAQADIFGYRVTGTAGVGLKVRTDPYKTTAAIVTVLAEATQFSAVCAVRGRDVLGNTVWHRISAPAQGWIADYYTTTPGFNQYIPGILPRGQPKHVRVRVMGS